MQRARDFRRGDGIEFAFVIIAVGQQDEDAALAFLDAIEPFHRHRRGIANRGAEFAHDADIHAVEVPLDPFVIQRRRADLIGHAGKHHEADAIRRPAGDEILEHLLRDVEARLPLVRRAHVEGHHRPGKIEHEQDVHAARLRLGLVVDAARPGERDDGQADRREAEEGKEPPRTRAHPRLSARTKFRGRKGEGRGRADAATQGKHVERQEREQREQPRILELEGRIPWPNPQRRCSGCGEFS